MSDSSSPVIALGKSPEQVAYELTWDILRFEGITRGENSNRKLILDTYGECLAAVRGYRDWKK